LQEQKFNYFSTAQKLGFQI